MTATRRTPQARRRWSILLCLVVVLLLGACSSSDSSADSASPQATESSVAETTVAFNQELHDELVAMMARDQGDRTGKPSDETDDDRIARLKEIIGEYGWPGFDLVGKKGEEAAWVIAQHADLDPTFQAEALDLLRAAVDAGQASAGNLAYLTDRVAVANGEPQTYGTQVGCTRKGPKPATPIEDESAVDDLRAEAGLDPLADYLDEMAEICSEDVS